MRVFSYSILYRSMSKPSRSDTLKNGIQTKGAQEERFRLRPVPQCCDSLRFRHAISPNSPFCYIKVAATRLNVFQTTNARRNWPHLQSPQTVHTMLLHNSSTQAGRDNTNNFRARFLRLVRKAQRQRERKSLNSTTPSPHFVK